MCAWALVSLYPSNLHSSGLTIKLDRFFQTEMMLLEPKYLTANVSFAKGYICAKFSRISGHCGQTKPGIY
jgi:hypothetical protein